VRAGWPVAFRCAAEPESLCPDRGRGARGTGGLSDRGRRARREGGKQRRRRRRSRPSDGPGRPCRAV